MNNRIKSSGSEEALQNTGRFTGWIAGLLASEMSKTSINWIYSPIESLSGVNVKVKALSANKFRSSDGDQAPGTPSSSTDGSVKSEHWAPNKLENIAWGLQFASLDARIVTSISSVIGQLLPSITVTL